MAAESPSPGSATAVRDVQKAVTADGYLTDGGNVTQLQITPSTPDLLGLPPELRNIIYQHNMDFAAEETNKNNMRHLRILTRPLGSATFGFTPAILRVCKQTRGECMQPFLASNDFYTEVRDTLWLSDGTGANPFRKTHKHGYGCLLHKLDLLGRENVRQIKSITIVSTDCGWQTFGTGPKFVKLWEDFIPELMSRGLKAHQLKWRGIRQPKRKSLRREWWEQVQRRNEDTVQRICHLEVWYRHVLLPALQMHGCLSRRSPIVDMNRQIGRLLLAGTVYGSAFYILGSGSRSSLTASLIAKLQDANDDETELDEVAPDDSTARK